MDGASGMKQVILYGVRHIELRREIEYFLDDEYEIVGYSDTWYESDVIGGKRFIPPQQLRYQQFDYILPLSFKEPVLADMRACLLDQGVPSEKIVKPMMFIHQNAEKMQLDLVKDIDENYHGEPNLMFGLSYSLRGINEKALSIPTYDCSWHGLDLYYAFKLFSYMKGSGSLLRGGGVALLVFPYYIFDYDLSRTLSHYKRGTNFALWRLDDWHSYRQIPDGADYVANYRMFGRKISEFYHFQRYQQENHGTYQGEDGTAALEKLWFCAHEETAAENSAVFSAFIRELRAQALTPVLIVPPYYLNGIEAASLEAVQKKKERFYHMVRAADRDLNVFDCMDRYSSRRELFADLTHLNSKGAEAFTNWINQKVLIGI